MLTVKIKDIGLQKRITEKARLLGKSTQELVNDLLNKELADNQSNVSYLQLDPLKHGYVIEYSDIDEQTASSKPFSHVVDTAEYSKELREKSWRKK